MKDRELGSMQIAGDRIRIVEKLRDEADVCQQKFIEEYHRLHPYPPESFKGGIPVSIWWAYKDDAIVGFGALTQGKEDDEESVWLWAYVAESVRSLGLGKLLIRFGTDQAIRYRKRTIWTVVHDGAPVMTILDSEEFEKQQEEAELGMALMKKELKWA